MDRSESLGTCRPDREGISRLVCRRQSVVTSNPPPPPFESFVSIILGENLLLVNKNGSFSGCRKESLRPDAAERGTRNENLPLGRAITEMDGN